MESIRCIRTTVVERKKNSAPIPSPLYALRHSFLLLHNYCSPQAIAFLVCKGPVGVSGRSIYPTEALPLQGPRPADRRSCLPDRKSPPHALSLSLSVHSSFLADHIFLLTPEKSLVIRSYRSPIG